MNYAMLSCLIPHEQAEFFKKNTKHTMQDAASALQWNIYSGLCENLGESIPLFNTLPADSFPQHYKYPFVGSTKFDKAGQGIGFCNVKLIRNFCKYRKIYRALNLWCKSTEGEKTLFIYTISDPFVRAVSKLKERYPKLRTCAIVADLPNMSNLSSSRTLLQKLYADRKSSGTFGMLKCIDRFVLLTEQMADYMKIDVPFMVMEGIAPQSELKTDYTQGDEKTVLYTGTLHKKFGVLHLVEAFRKIPDKDFRLVICGIGDSEEEIVAQSKEDSRIKFMGQLNRNEVLSLQKKATVLVNPRLNNEEFTKYSFPSKTMEYLASGVPVVAYELDGIPKEYRDYITYPKDDEADTLANVIMELCNLTEAERKSIGQKGQKFVLENKNSLTQSKRILQFVLSE